MKAIHFLNKSTIILKVAGRHDNEDNFLCVGLVIIYQLSCSMTQIFILDPSPAWF